MVVISKVYTRTGDGGRTRLSDLSETGKTDARVEAYGDVDEANAAIGVALATWQLPDEVAAVLGFLQNELFDLGADLSTPLVSDPEQPPLRIVQPCIDRLERWCDEFADQLTPLRSFVLPGGSPASAQLHVARTVVRRAERRAWAAVEQLGTEPATEGAPGGVNLLALTYLNRLSDLLFVLTRVVSGSDEEVLWVPGSDRAEVAGPTG